MNATNTSIEITLPEGFELIGTYEAGEIRNADRSCYISFNVNNDDEMDEDGDIVSDDFFHIQHIFVAAEHRRQGIARKLLHAAVKISCAIGLTAKLIVMPDNSKDVDSEVLEKFYGSEGFYAEEGAPGLMSR